LILRLNVKNKSRYRFNFLHPRLKTKVLFSYFSISIICNKIFTFTNTPLLLSAPMARHTRMHARTHARTHTHKVQILLKDSVFILSHTVLYPTVCQSHSSGEDSVKHTSNTLFLCERHSILVLLAFSCPRVMSVHTQICLRQMK